MSSSNRPGRPWPCGYRILLWAVGSLLVVLVIVAIVFLTSR
ncbi:MAG: hypothetical protein ACYDCI_08980 [Candidatus Limnocylindrales bacterium]